MRSARLSSNDHPAAFRLPAAAPEQEARIWLKWVGFTTAGYLLRALLTGLAPQLPFTLVAAVTAAVIGIVFLALLQRAVLSLYVPDLRPGLWVLATAGGYLIGTLAVLVGIVAPLSLGLAGGLVRLIGGTSFTVLTRVLSGALVGGAVAACQALVLRRSGRVTPWWFAAGAGAAAIAALPPPEWLIHLRLLGGISLREFVEALLTAAVTGVGVIALLRARRAAAPA